MQGEYEAEVLGYDADFSDNSQYCVHGTFIGSWWGPDYLCGWCEDGISEADFRAAMDYRESCTRRKNLLATVFSSWNYIGVPNPNPHSSLCAGVITGLYHSLGK
jgi:hypothetical protein